MRIRLVISLSLCLAAAFVGPAVCQEALDAVVDPAPAQVAQADASQPAPEVSAPVSAPAAAAVVAEPEKKQAVQEKVVADKPKVEIREEKPQTHTSTTAPVKDVKPGASAPQANRRDRVAMLMDHESKPKPAGQAVGGWAKTALVTLLKLAFVLVLAYLTLLALRWLSVKRETAADSARDMKVVETLRLPSGGQLHLVSVQGRSLVIGSSAGGVSLLTELDGEAAPEETEDAGGRFAQYLEKYSVGGNPPSRKATAGRIAALLRDCASHLRERANGRRGEKNDS